MEELKFMLLLARGGKAKRKDFLWSVIHGGSFSLADLILFFSTEMESLSVHACFNSLSTQP